jgi:hypothetical protein
VLTGAASRLRTELGGSNRPPYEIYHQMGPVILSLLVYGRIFLGIRADALCPWYV